MFNGFLWEIEYRVCELRCRRAVSFQACEIKKMFEIKKNGSSHRISRFDTPSRECLCRKKRGKIFLISKIWYYVVGFEHDWQLEQLEMHLIFTVAAARYWIFNDSHTLHPSLSAEVRVIESDVLEGLCSW